MPRMLANRCMEIQQRAVFFANNLILRVVSMFDVIAAESG